MQGVDLVDAKTIELQWSCVKPGVRPERQETKGDALACGPERWQVNDAVTELAGAKPVKAIAIDAAD